MSYDADAHARLYSRGRGRVLDEVRRFRAGEKEHLSETARFLLFEQPERTRRAAMRRGDGAFLVAMLGLGYVPPRRRRLALDALLAKDPDLDFDWRRLDDRVADIRAAVSEQFLDRRHPVAQVAERLLAALDDMVAGLSGVGAGGIGAHLSRCRRAVAALAGPAGQSGPAGRAAGHSGRPPRHATLLERAGLRLIKYARCYMAGFVPDEDMSLDFRASLEGAIFACDAMFTRSEE